MNWRKWSFALAYGVLFACWLVMMYIFFTAYFHETKAVVVAVDKFGEAHAEAAIFIISVPIVLWFFNEVLRLELLDKRVETLEKRVREE